MTKVKSLADLKKLRDELHQKTEALSKKESPESIIQVKVAMATCGIASGAKIRA